MDMKEYLNQSKNTAPTLISEELGREIYETDLQLLLDLCKRVLIGCDVADVIKRSLYYKEKRQDSGKRIASYTSDLQLFIEELYQLKHEKKQVRLSSQQIDLIHAALGHISEAGETLSQVIRSITQGVEMDEVNLREEAGDKLWYSALELRALHTDFETQADKNIKKLAARYPEKFDCDKALNRDLDKEREILES